MPLVWSHKEKTASAIAIQFLFPTEEVDGHMTRCGAMVSLLLSFFDVCINFSDFIYNNSCDATSMNDHVT